MRLVSIATPFRRSRPIAAVICWLLLAAPICRQTKASGRNDVNDPKDANPADIVHKLLEVNSVWLDPPPNRLSYTLYGKDAPIARIHAMLSDLEEAKFGDQ